MVTGGPGTGKTTLVRALLHVVREQGDYQRARELYRESLVINRELGDRRAVAFVLEDISCLAALEGQSESALRLVAAATAIRDDIGAPLAPNDQEKLSRNLAPARESLSLEGQAGCIAHRSRSTIHDAIIRALQL